MDSLLLHDITRRQLAAAVASPAHALLLTGQLGAGLRTVAEQLGADLLTVAPDRFLQQPYVRSFAPIDGSLGVEQAKEIIGFLRLRTTGPATIRRVIILDSIDLMTFEAQNMLLKTLEEPPIDTVVLMTAHDSGAVLSTVRSRSQALAVLPVSLAATTAYFTERQFARPAIEQAYRVSGGAVGLMVALLNGKDNHPLLGYVAKAKQLLGASAFERLATVDQLIKDKEQKHIVWALIRTSEAALATSALKPGNEAAIKRWVGILRATTAADEQLSSNGQAKLVMTNLFLSM